MSMTATADQTIVSRAVQKVTHIGTLPEITAKIIEIVEDPRSAAKDLESIIKHDMGLSANILKVVNSAFYGLPRQVGSVERAIVLLGLSTVKNIALATSITKLFAGHGLTEKFSAKDLWRHSLACGVFCKILAQEKQLENSDEIFVAGLMHDIGVLVERQVYPKNLDDAIEMAQVKKMELWEAEMDTIGADHQAFGAALAVKWKFPQLFQVGTGYHHQPLRTSEPHRQLACTVHLADVLANRKQVGFYLKDTSWDDDILAVLELSESDVEAFLEGFDEKFAAAELAMN